MKKLYLTTGSAQRGDKVEFTAIAVTAESSWEAERKATKINYSRFASLLDTYYGHRLTPMDEIEPAVIARMIATGYEKWLYVLTATRAGGAPYRITSTHGIAYAVDEQTKDVVMARNIEKEFPPREGWVNRQIAYCESFPEDVWREVVGG
jgi:hypothetical protein